MARAAATGRAIKERRKHQRLPLCIPVFVRGVDQNGKEFLEFATVLNISASGVLLANRRSLPVAGRVSLEIPVPSLALSDIAPRSVRNLRARLVRVAHGEQCHLVGLKFDRVLRN
jgi:hypothetical protein